MVAESHRIRVHGMRARVKRERGERRGER